MNRGQASAVVVLILFMAAGLGEELAISSSIPNATSLPETPRLLDPSQLHHEILSSYDAGHYSETARLLEEMKTRYVDRYNQLPYELLHARCLFLAGDKAAAFEIYNNLANDDRYAVYSLLPLARIAVDQGKKDAAIGYYQRYLSEHKNTEYYGVALEALQYALLLKSQNALQTLATEVEGNPATRRTGQFYLAKAYMLQNNTPGARAIFRSLVEKGIKDDVSSHSISELDAIEGNDLSREDRIFRGNLASQFWNFDLARKYLEPYSMETMQNAYSYGRALFFLGDSNGAKTVFQQAIEKWPQDSMMKLCLFQYANICLRENDFKKAESLYEMLIGQTVGRDREIATYKLVQSLRAQSRLEEALVALQPLSYSKAVSERVPSLFLRGRIYYQAGRYQEALVDFNQLLETRSGLNKKEVLFWKGMAQEKLNKKVESKQTFVSLSQSEDFFGMLARQKLAANSEAMKAVPVPSAASAYEHHCGLPDQTKEAAVIDAMSSGDIYPALLYLHLYEEASRNLDSISATTWKVMGIDPKDRFRKYLEIAHLASLGGNYPVAANYSDVLQKRFLKNVPLSSLPEDVLMILFPYPFRESIEPLSRQRGLDPYYVVSIMKQESQFKRYAKSPMFARGLMQLIPPTALSMVSLLGISDFTQDELYHPEVNINLGTRYLQEMVKKFGERPEVIAASYNSGESNVMRWLACTSSNEVMEFFSNIDLAETKDYVVQVTTTYNWYRRIYGNNQIKSAAMTETETGVSN